MCFIVLYCIVLYCIVLYCILLYFIVFYCILLYFIVFYCIVLYYIVFYCILLYFIVFYCIALYCIVLYCMVSLLAHHTIQYSQRAIPSSPHNTLLLVNLLLRFRLSLLFLFLLKASKILTLMVLRVMVHLHVWKCLLILLFVFVNKCWRCRCGVVLKGSAKEGLEGLLIISGLNIFWCLFETSLNIVNVVCCFQKTVCTLLQLCLTFRHCLGGIATLKVQKI